MIARARAFVRRHPDLAWTLALIDAAAGALVTGAVSIWWLGFAWWSITLAAASAVVVYALSLLRSEGRREAQP